MRFRRFPKRSVLIFASIFATSLLIGITSFYAFAAQPAKAPHTVPAATNPWFELQQRNPYPYTLPLAPAIRTPIDGAYTKMEVTENPTVHCRRCPDYAPEGGLWKLRFDKGVFRIYHADTGWKGIGTFLVTTDFLAEIPTGQLVLANDPVCQEVIGVYRWKLEQGKLFLSVIEDPCAIRLRALNLTHLAWLACQPPGQEAAISGHWPVPVGCEK